MDPNDSKLYAGLVIPALMACCQRPRVHPLQTLGLRCGQPANLHVRFQAQSKSAGDMCTTDPSPMDDQDSFIDNIFRFVQAGSEVSALLGRLTSAVGYQPTLAP